MIERKIKFTLSTVKYKDRIKDTCRDSIRVKDGYKTRTMDIIYPYMELELNKEYEAVIFEEIRTNVSKVKDIIEINNISTFIKEVLANDKNINNKIKENIVKGMGEEPIERLMDSTEKLIELGVLNEDKAKYINDKAKKYNNLLVIREYCKSNKIPESIANSLYKDLGAKTLDVIRHNYYLLSDYGVSLKKIDLIANKVGLAHNNINRVKCWVIEYNKYCSKKFGHVFIVKKKIIENLNGYMNKYGGFSGMNNIRSEVIQEAIFQLKVDGIVRIHINENDEECMYIKKLFEFETGIADIISRKLLKKVEVSESIKEKVDSFIKNYSGGDKKLTNEQAQALKNSITENISLLHGYPGTGKTQTLRAIVGCINAIYKEANVEVVAFTGKAVTKAKEVLTEDGTSAKTIHRFLGLNKDKKFIPKQTNVDFLIIEESTMVDMELFYYILKSIKDDTRILLLGDECQLCSIGAGEVFANLIKSNLIKTVKLTKIFRQGEGSTIIKNIHKMAKGIGFTDENGLKCKKGEFELVDLKRETDITEKIKQTVDKLIKDNHRLNDVQILSSAKEYIGGTKNLNKIIQEQFNPNPRREFYNIVAGDKVMQNVNNYNFQNFNGEIGVIIKNEDGTNGRRVIVKYRDKCVEYKNNRIKELESAFAITIHKSQGSDFPIVILPLLKKDKETLNKNLLYTGCSRAKKQVIIIAASDTFDTAIKKVQNGRNSNLIEMIIDRLKEIEDRIA